MKARSATGETRRGAPVGQCETARLIVHVSPGAACPGDRATVLAPLADAAALLRAKGASCPGCELAPSCQCDDHEQALVRADGHIRLAAQLRRQR
jgi:hypothetical protein